MIKDKNTYDEQDQLNLKLVVGLHRSLQKDVKSLNATLAEYGLTTAQFGVLETLYHKGDQRICEIIDKTLSTSGNMTVVIKNLEKLGYISKSKDPNDGRASIIALTEAGKKLISEIFPIHLKALREVFKSLNNEDKKNLSDLLKKMNGL